MMNVFEFELEKKREKQKQERRTRKTTSSRRGIAPGAPGAMLLVSHAHAKTERPSGSLASVAAAGSAAIKSGGAGQ